MSDIQLESVSTQPSKKQNINVQKQSSNISSQAPFSVPGANFSVPGLETPKMQDSVAPQSPVEKKFICTSGTKCTAECDYATEKIICRRSS